MKIEIKDKNALNLHSKFGLPVWRLCELEIPLLNEMIEAYSTRFEYTDLGIILINLVERCANEMEVAVTSYRFGKLCRTIEVVPPPISIKMLMDLKKELENVK